jgi:hypothetical protein
LLDVFFISMGEEGCEANWQRLLEFVPNAKRVNNVKGIYNVHKACATLSTSDNFWVVDADAYIVDGFDFNWKPDPSTLHWNVPETECVVIWPSINPVNGLEYGYGAVKVFPRKPFLENKPWSIDMSSSIVNVVVSKDTISCETRFNATAESAWIGAFRECAKLASLSMIKARIRKIKATMNAELAELGQYVATQDWDDSRKANYRAGQTALIHDRYKNEISIFNYWNEVELCSQRRLTWCTHGWDKVNGKAVILGAQAGSAFGLKYSDDLATLDLINDWNWLKKEFKNVVI